MKALGMIEVYGYLTAVAALDSALKAADVHLLDVTLVKGGYVTVLITGDVGAVKAAIDASSSYAKNLGTVLSVHVIPRPEDSVEAMLRQVRASEVKEELRTSKEEYDQKRDTDVGSDQLQTGYTKEVLEGMTVENLRNLARKLGITNLTRKEIKYANKKQLIQSIRGFLEQER